MKDINYVMFKILKDKLCDFEEVEDSKLVSDDKKTYIFSTLINKEENFIESNYENVIFLQYSSDALFTPFSPVSLI